MKNLRCLSPKENVAGYFEEHEALMGGGKHLLRNSVPHMTRVLMLEKRSTRGLLAREKDTEAIVIPECPDKLSLLMSFEAVSIVDSGFFLNFSVPRCTQSGPHLHLRLPGPGRHRRRAGPCWVQGPEEGVPHRQRGERMR